MMRHLANYHAKVKTLFLYCGHLEPQEYQKAQYIYIYIYIYGVTGYYSHPGEGGYYSANPCMYLGKARMYP